MRKRALNKLTANEKGQALIIVVVLMLLSALIIAPMLSHVSSGLETGREVFEEKMYGQYAADSGVEDALYKINLDDSSLPPEWEGVWDSDSYDISHIYYLPSQVNDNDVKVTIQPQWLLQDLEDPPTGMLPHADMVVVGDTIDSTEDSRVYQISITYNGELGELFIERIGVWLPGYCDYEEGSSNLEQADPGEKYHCIPVSQPHRGGEAIIWSFGSPRPKFEDFPPGYGDKRTVTFEFTAEQTPYEAFSWVVSKRNDVYLSWDVDIKLYKITSQAEDADSGKLVIVEAYTATNELRELGAAISGDYCAVGNTLLTATGTSDYEKRFRDNLFRESSATVQEFTGAGDVPPGYVPENAHLEAAYLYWSGWIEGAADATSVWSDDCDTLDNWDPGSRWSLYPPWGPGDKEFMGQGSGSDASRTLSMYIWDNAPIYSLDLEEYSGQVVTVSWGQREWESGWGQQLEDDDCLKFAFSGDGGSSWSEEFVAFCDDDPLGSFSYPIPDEYVTDNFRMYFFLDFDANNEYCYIDDISISVSSGSSVEDAKVNRVIFNGNQITAEPVDCQEAPTPDSGAPDSWCYSCFYDATDLVQQLIDDEDIESSGAGTYTLGHWMEGSEYDLDPSGSTDYPLATPAQRVGFGWYAAQYEWAYAGWSLILIYSNPETKGHQLYLFDEFRYIAVRTTLEFPISGFIVPEPVAGEDYAAHLTCFVGDGDEQYSGDFIALNAPEGVPGYQIPNEYKLWDGISVESISTPWSGEAFPNNAGSPNNVWNSQSVGITADGIDIDNFNVTWEWALDHDLGPGETSAEVVLGNASSDERDAELIMVVYLIISFRSSVVTGGANTYLYVGGG